MLQGFEVACVGQGEAHRGEVGRDASLREAALSVDLDRLPLVRGEGATGGGALDEAGQFELIRGGHKDDAVEAFVPGAAASVSGCKKKRGLDHGDGLGIGCAEGLELPFQLRENGGMHKGIKFLDPRMIGVEGEGGESAAIKRTVGGQDLRPEMVKDRREDGLAGPHHRAANLVGAEPMGAHAGEQATDRGFPTREFAGEADPQHPSQPTRRNRAALTVLAMRVAMVSAPTPPGTGV